MGGRGSSGKLKGGGGGSRSVKNAALLEEAFGKLPAGYANASDEKKMSYYKARLNFAENQLRSDKAMLSKIESGYKKGAYDKKRSSSDVMSDMTFYRKSIKSKESQVAKMKKALS